jgi:hypothetical protein
LAASWITQSPGRNATWRSIISAVAGDLEHRQLEHVGVAAL